MTLFFHPLGTYSKETFNKCIYEEVITEICAMKKEKEKEEVEEVEEVEEEEDKKGGEEEEKEKEVGIPQVPPVSKPAFKVTLGNNH